MNLLLTNDDGVEAPGLRALARGLRDLGTVTVVAPATEQSARSHAFSMDKALLFQSREPGWYSLLGTPADCVYVALHHICAQPPSLVISGINRGTNLGDDIHYSGTVGAAMEGALQGYRALAVSQDRARQGEEQHWDTAVETVREVLATLGDEPWPEPVVLNLNVPNVAGPVGPKLRLATMGRRSYHPRVDVRQDPRGRSYCWIGGEHRSFGSEAGTDGQLHAQGFATLTPIGIDLTSQTALQWLEDQSLDLDRVQTT